MSLGMPAQNHYGFADQHCGVFAKLQVILQSLHLEKSESGFFSQEEIPSIVDCPDPDHMTSHERRLGRIAHEEASFDPEHYLYAHNKQ